MIYTEKLRLESRDQKDLSADIRMGIDLELDGTGCTQPKLDEDLKTVIAGADLQNDLMSREIKWKSCKGCGRA